MAVAVLLARESKGLLVGEAMDRGTLEQIRTLVEQDESVELANCPLSVYFGPETIILALQIEFCETLRADEISGAVDRIEHTIQQHYPAVRRIFVEAESIRRAGELKRAG
jgi:divalent metal cation (Fe/Co/Zn/Cd) transporter